MTSRDRFRPFISPQPVIRTPLRQPPPTAPVARPMAAPPYANAGR